MKKQLGLLLMIFALLTIFPISVKAEAATNQEEKTSPANQETGLINKNDKYYYYKNGTKVTSQWVTLKKQRYYFNRKGVAAIGLKTIKKKMYLFNDEGKLLRSASAKKNKIVTYRNKKYYVSKSGTVQTGWQLIGKKLYYFSTRTNAMQKNKTVSGIELTKKGYAKTTDKNTRLKILTMSIVQKITTDAMSQDQKLRACYNYVVRANGYTTWRAFSNYAGWEADYAYEFLTYKRGNCYNFAAAFGYLAKEVGYTPYIIRGRVPGSRDGAGDGYTRHSWIMINGLHYDPEAEYAGWARGIYGSGSAAGYIVEKSKI